MTEPIDFHDQWITDDTPVEDIIEVGLGIVIRGLFRYHKQPDVTGMDVINEGMAVTDAIRSTCFDLARAVERRD